MSANNSEPGRNDQRDVSAKTELAAERVESAVEGCDVMARDWPTKGEVIIVSFEAEVARDVNSFQKAGRIDDVYQSGANVELYDACDGDEQIVFQVRDRGGD